MNKYKVPEGNGLRFTQQAFSELELVETLFHEDTGNASPRIVAGELFSYVRGDLTQETRIKEGLLKFPAMRTALRDMISQASAYHMPEAIAASSGEFPERQVEGCRVRVKASLAEADQYHLIIDKLEEGRNTLSLMTLCGIEGEIEQVPLPEARRGIIQLVVKAGNGILKLLRDPKTGIYLR